MLGPKDPLLAVGELLGAWKVLDPRETVVAPQVSDLGGVELAGEPFPAVYADVHRQGQPTLHAHVQPAEHRVDPVTVEVQALAFAHHQVDVFGLAVAEDVEAGAGFDATEDTDQPAADAVLFGDPAGDRFLVGGAAVDVDDRSSGGLGGLLDPPPHPLGHRLGVVAELLEQDAHLREQSSHAGNVTDGSQRPAKAKTIEPTERSPDDFGMPFDKLIHGVASLFGVCWQQPRYEAQRRLPFRRI